MEGRQVAPIQPAGLPPSALSAARRGRLRGEQPAHRIAGPLTLEETGQGRTEREYRLRVTERASGTRMSYVTFFKLKAASSELVMARRFNPKRVAWLPIRHTTRGCRHYTALFSNAALAHRLNRTNDLVVIYWDDGIGERQCTVVTADRGSLAGYRVVRGREAELLKQEYSDVRLSA